MINEVIKSRIPNSKIISKVKFGSRHKKLSVGGYYFYLYKTTCLINGLVYVGAKASKIDPAIDWHVGDGTGGKKAKRNYTTGTICLASLYNKYSRVHFVREDLLFFDTYSDMVKALAIVVDKKFVDDSRTFNTCVGGSIPMPIPANSGKGTQQQQKIMNELIQPKYRYSATSLKTEELVLIDCYTKNLEIEIITSMKEAEIRFEYADKTISNLLAQKGCMIIEDRYLLIKLSKYSRLKKEVVERYVHDQFATYKDIKKRRFIMFQVHQEKMQLEFSEVKSLYPGMKDFNLRALIKTCK